MKNKEIFISTVIFFLLINSSYYWEGKLGFFAIPFFLVLIAAFFGLTVALLRQIYFSIKERFKTLTRIPLIGLLTIVIFLTYHKPKGIIDFDKLEGNNLLIAEREGAANCMTTLKLKENFSFREKVGCFGTFETKGKFRVVKDTIFFDNVELPRHEKEYFKYALVIQKESKNSKILYDLAMYKNDKDTLPLILWITKNDLYKLNNDRRTANMGFAAMLADE